MSIQFTSVDKSNLDMIRWIRYLDSEIFPIDIPSKIDPNHWFLGWHKNDAIAFCAWQECMSDGTNVGFHYRAGVLPAYRGMGIQKQMLKLREDDMNKFNLTVAVSYTEVYSSESMRSLISCGYRPFTATDNTNLTTIDRYKRFVYWKKNLD
jgi:GNAT superfamily N-acetyltransferase